MTEVRFAFTPTTAQLRWMLEVHYGTLWMWLRTAGLTLTLVGAFVFGYVEKPLGVALVVVGLTVFLLPALHKHRGVRQMMALPTMGQRDVLISESSVEVTMRHAAVRYDMSLLTAVVEGQLGWLLIADGTAATIVPRDAITAEQATFMTAFAAQHGNATP